MEFIQHGLRAITEAPWVSSHLPLILIALALWDLVWKAVGLWFSARNYQKVWFTAIFILNTLGILPIIYLLWFRRDKEEGVTRSLFEKTLPGPEDDSDVEVA